MNATIQLEGPRKGAALAISLGVHALLVLLMFLLKIVTPIPPFELGGGPGMELGIADIGYSMEGMGDDGSMSESASSSDAGGQPEESNENLLAEEDGEPIDAPPNKPDQPTTDRPVVRPNNKPPKITEPEVNPNALFNPSGNPGDGDGDGEEGDGDSDKPGNVGIPGGMRGGDGWSMRGNRGAMRGPDLSERPRIQNETWVEVAIVIDRNGKVLRTSISDAAIQRDDIHQVARRAVSKMEFVANPNGPQEQVQYVRITLRPG